MFKQRKLSIVQQHLLNVEEMFLQRHSNFKEFLKVLNLGL
jgi:hypothetical protein